MRLTLTRRIAGVRLCAQMRAHLCWRSRPSGSRRRSVNTERQPWQWQAAHVADQRRRQKAESVRYFFLETARTGSNRFKSLIWLKLGSKPPYIGPIRFSQRVLWGGNLPIS